MKKRKLTDAGRCSTRQKNRKFSAPQTASDREAETCKSTKDTRVASEKTTEKQPSKKAKCDENPSPEAPGLLCKGDDPASAKSSAPSGRGRVNSGKTATRADAGGRKCPKTEISVRAAGIPLPSADDSARLGVTDDSADGLGFDDLAQSAVSRRERNSVSVDSGSFVDEDSNQPMPLGRIFENADLMQDLPPVTPFHASMSRRELRNLHFRAKEEDEDEDEDDEEQNDNVNGADI
ncbi:UPF0688 protein C1orf174 homolog [Spea bombifrons]|uniref:UPF0688 protein C1orf174 homolog n=1 Tax=Spea bombifrons TaxID=233779 RepID=UPI002349893D|nr:UPF0688 protein C1orf174 homolog [Spea bombifrons]